MAQGVGYHHRLVRMAFKFHQESGSYSEYQILRNHAARQLGYRQDHGFNQVDIGRWLLSHALQRVHD